MTTVFKSKYFHKINENMYATEKPAEKLICENCSELYYDHLDFPNCPVFVEFDEIYSITY